VQNVRQGDGTPCRIGNISHTRVERIVQTVDYRRTPYTAFCKSYYLHEIPEAQAALEPSYIISFAESTKLRSPLLQLVLLGNCRFRNCVTSQKPHMRYTYCIFLKLPAKQNSLVSNFIRLSYIVNTFNAYLVLISLKSFFKDDI
jgi:hypothetical protein